MMPLQGFQAALVLLLVVLPLAGWLYTEIELHRLYAQLMDTIEKYEGSEEE